MGADWGEQALVDVTVEDQTVVVWVNRSLDSYEIAAVQDEASSALEHSRLDLTALEIRDASSGTTQETRPLEQ